jgi:hypothetical protein
MNLSKEERTLPIEYFNRILSLKGLPFWISDKVIHEKEFEDNYVTGSDEWSFCCFNHAIGLPKKFGLSFPIHDYEMALLNLQLKENFRKIVLLKSRGLGATELCLRKAAWLCTYSDIFAWSQMALISGASQLQAIDLMKRLKNLFLSRLGIIFPYSEKVCYLNKVTIVSYPSNRVEPLRGRANITYFLIDEADFFYERLQKEIMDIVFGYHTKSDPLVDMISTPNLPYGLFYRLEHTPRENRDYTFVKFNYEVGLGKIYTQREIDTMKRVNPSAFAREMDCQYGYGTGQLFSEFTIDMIRRYGTLYKLDSYHPPIVNRYTKKVLVGDPAYGENSEFGTLILEYMQESNCVRVLHAETELMSDQDLMKNKILNLYHEYNPKCIYIDGHWVGLIRALRRDPAIHDVTDEYTIAQYEKESSVTKRSIEEYFTVNGKLFSGKTREMASHAKTFIETEGLFACDPLFENLLADLAGAELLGGKLVKNAKKPRDLVDCIFMGLEYFYI